MAMERKFPHIKPKQKNCAERKGTNTKILGFGAFRKKMVYIKPIMVKAKVAIHDNFRIPNRMTNVPFKNVDSPMEMANPAKMYGKTSFKL